MASSQTYSTIFSQKKRLLFISGLFGLVLALVISLFQPLEYRAEASILVIPNFAGDGYQASRSAEKYAATLTSVLPSLSFYKKVAVLEPSVTEMFQGSDAKVRKAWEKAINGTVKPNTGILNLEVYARSATASENLLSTVVRVLEQDGASYLGGHPSVLLYTINQPIVSRFPVRPNYPVNLFGGFVLGLLASAVVVVVRSEFRLPQTMPVIRQETRVQPVRNAVQKVEAPEVQPVQEELPSVRELMKQRFGYEPQEIRAMVHGPVQGEEEPVQPVQEEESVEQQEVFTPDVVNLLRLNRDLRESGQWSTSGHRESDNV